MEVSLPPHPERIRDFAYYNKVYYAVDQKFFLITYCLNTTPEHTLPPLAPSIYNVQCHTYLAESLSVYMYCSCGGNLLMNIGPTHDGRIIPIFEERLRQVGKLSPLSIYLSAFLNKTVLH